MFYFLFLPRKFVFMGAGMGEIERDFLKGKTKKKGKMKKEGEKWAVQKKKGGWGGEEVQQMRVCRY